MTAVKTKAEIIAMMRDLQKEIPPGVSIHDYHLRSIEIMFDVAATILSQQPSQNERRNAPAMSPSSEA